MAEPDQKRRLPLLQSNPGADDPPEEERPPWHWSGIGAVATFLVWLPLAAMAAKLGARLADGEPDPLPARVQLAIVASQLAGFLIAAFAGGFLVGRFGGKAGRREGAAGAFFAAALAWALAAAAPSRGPGAVTWALLLVLLGGAGAATGYLGGRVGEKQRRA
jgi:tRNA-(ms[2]io[6]A)-hydroxylase